MISVKLPSGRVVQIDTDDPKQAAAAARKFVASNAYESARLNSHGIAGQVGAGLQTAIRAVPGASELEAAIPAAMGRGGADFGSAWKHARDQQQGWVDEFKAEHPVLSNLVTGTANAAPIAAAILTGGASEAPEAAAAGEKGIAGLLKPIVARTARRAVAGGAAGAVMGASQPGSISDRLHSANTGAAVGGVVGAVAPPIITGSMNLGGNVARSTASAVGRVANKMTGGALLDANATASSRLVEALKADGATPDALKAALNGFLKNGATDPTLIDVASRLPSGGQNTLALVRGAATKGTGRGIAATYADQTAADLQDKAIAATRKLTPEARSATTVRDAATEARRVGADAEYRAPYPVPVDAAPVLPAMEGNAGRTAINAAHGDADTLRLGDQMAELDKLRKVAGPEETPVARIGGDTLPDSPSLTAKIKDALGTGDGQVPVSLGTLDRVKIALNDAGQAAAKGGQNSRAAGFFQRAAEIDDHLAAQNPEYAAARDNYARRSAGIEAIDHGATGLHATPDDYAATLEDLKAKAADPNAAEEVNPAEAGAQVGYRQSITDALGAPTEGATGSLNRVSTATNQKRNLAATFGPEGAEAYQAGLRDLTEQLRNARFVNPNTGSATAGRLADLGLVEPGDIAMPHLSAPRIALRLINKIIRNGATLTDEERGLITRMGVTPANLDQIDLSDTTKMLPPQMLEDMRAYVAGAGSQPRNRETTP